MYIFTKNYWKRFITFNKLTLLEIDPKSICNKANSFTVFISVFQSLPLSSNSFSICFNPFSTYIVGGLEEIKIVKRKNGCLHIEGSVKSKPPLTFSPFCLLKGSDPIASSTQAVKACAVTWLAQHRWLRETNREGKPLGTWERFDRAGKH